MATSGDDFLRAALPALDLVHNLARRFAPGRADAEDLVQETYLRAWQAWTAGRPPRRVEPWLATICLNLGRDRARRAASHLWVTAGQVPDLAGPADVEADAMDRLRRGQVERALRALPEPQRVAVTLMDLGGFTAAEAAQVMGSPRGSVLAWVHRGRKTLARLVREHEQEGTAMGHDPQRAAAAYLGGQLGRRQRERFETHLLACEACWGEVQAGRRGRALAESVRELARQQLRERVRATVEAHPARPPRRGRARAAAALVALVLAGVLAGGVLVTRQHSPQPRVIAAAVAAYQAGGPATIGPAGSPPARQSGELRWRGSGRGVVGGLPVVAHSYQDAAGRRVVLLVADRPFPMAAGARHDAADTWVAESGGVVLFCADRPARSLLVGPDRARVLLAADGLGLTGDHRPGRAP